MRQNAITALRSLPYAPKVATDVISTNPAEAMAEFIIRKEFADKLGYLADSNNEIDLLRMIAACIGKHRKFLAHPRSAKQPVTAGFLALANRFQNGL